MVCLLCAESVYALDRPDSVKFSGYDWIVKETRRPIGPGPNIFSDESVETGAGFAGLRIALERKSWVCAELTSAEYFSYGTFTLDFEIPSGLDSMAVFGFFLYNEAVPPHYNEIDYEVSRWGNPGSEQFSFSVQPYLKEGNSVLFGGADSGRFICTIEWLPGRVNFSLNDKDGAVIRNWSYTGADVPEGTLNRVHLNLWLFEGLEPAGDGGLEVKAHSFVYNNVIDLQ